MTLLLIWQGAPFDAIEACLALAGSNQFLIDSVLFFEEYDQLATQHEKDELQKIFLIKHGARYIKHGGQRILVGGVYPVRWCPYQM